MASCRSTIIVLTVLLSFSTACCAHDNWLEKSSCSSFGRWRGLRYRAGMPWHAQRRTLHLPVSPKPVCRLSCKHWQRSLKCCLNLPYSQFVLGSLLCSLHFVSPMTIESVLEYGRRNGFACVIEELTNQLSVSKNYVSVLKDEATIEARKLDSGMNKDRASLSQLKLCGVPVAVKDNICVRGCQMTAGSRSLEQYISSYDATVITRLRQSGALIIGKTTMDEFAMGSTTEPSCYGETTNPIDSTRSAGGSSGGSAATVACGEVPVALGSDSGGSVRLPAAWCGCVGLKPTYGRVSRYGLVPYVSTTDVVGVLANNVQDAAMVLHSIAGKDSRDATSINAPVPAFTAGLMKASDAADMSVKPLQGLKVGVLREALENSTHMHHGVSESFKYAVDILEGMGASTEVVSIPNLEAVCAAFSVRAMDEASSNLSRYDCLRYGLKNIPENLSVTSRRSDTVGDEVKMRLLVGNLIVSRRDERSLREAADFHTFLLHKKLQNIFEAVDIVVTPTSPTVAKLMGSVDDPCKDDIYLAPASLAGLPALSVPSRPCRQSGLPVGLQLIGKREDELSILQAAMAFEQSNIRLATSS
eukprot:GHVQ01014519.1.p1 GENE.GHVQ01014519.1~~GHVQ01014519.1.p1  ORF type:complete len:586 (+),score=59.94 GHVQ01014519.1:51-1808(+)